MKVMPGLYYSEEHEWVRVEGERAYVGITDYAQHHLGDIVFVELPEVDDELAAGDTVGVVESVKAASDVYCPIGGKVVEVNEALLDDPAAINNDAFEAWIAVLEIADAAQLDDLMDAAAYEAFCAE